MFTEKLLINDVYSGTMPICLVRKCEHRINLDSPENCYQGNIPRFCSFRLAKELRFIEELAENGITKAQFDEAMDMMNNLPKGKCQYSNKRDCDDCDMCGSHNQ